MPLYSWDETAPRIAESAFVADDAIVIGDVTIGDEASIWFGSVLRADNAAISIGRRSNLQDGVLAHVDPDTPVRVGIDCTIAHGVVLHGCTVGDGSLVGIGARVLNNAVIGAGSLVAAGAVVPEGKEYPAGSLIVGTPARVVRELAPDHLERLRIGAQHYVERANEWSSRARLVGGPS